MIELFPVRDIETVEEIFDICGTTVTFGSSSSSSSESGSDKNSMEQYKTISAELSDPKKYFSERRGLTGMVVCT